MPVVMKSKTNEKKTSSAADILKQFQKDKGETIGSFGGSLVNGERLQTTIFPLDLALGGGFPRGKCSIIYGPESSNKTNIALLAVAEHQRTHPKLTCVFFDIEHALDPAWAKQLGVNTDKLIVIKPEYAEQAVDMAETFLYADDCGVVIIDSLAALMTSSEIEASAERANVGGSALVIGKLTRRTTLALQEAEKKGNFPTLIYINQISYKIGVMFGDPETMPGGKKPAFQAGIILRVYGKNKLDPKVSKVMPVLKEVSFIVKKYKCPILATSGRFEMATMPYSGLQVGQCDDFNTVSEYLKTFGQFQKEEKGKGWQIMGEHYDTIQPFETRLYTDPAFGHDVRQMIIGRMLASGDMIPSQEDKPA
jgi:recombination protein RecA